LRQILGLDRRWRVCLAGAGRLGAALYQYEGFRRQGFDFVAVFDRDPAKIGRRWGELKVEDVARLAEVVADRGIEMGVIVTPRESAQEVADRLIEAGVEAILNFAPKKVSVPRGVTLRDVNLAIEIEGLSFALTHAGEIVTAG
jgi:redox-sensing transcriptional repressor